MNINTMDRLMAKLGEIKTFPTIANADQALISYEEKLRQALEVAEELISLYQKSGEATASLLALVALKNYKEANGKDGIYQHRQELAWSRARHALVGVGVPIQLVEPGALSPEFDAPEIYAVSTTDTDEGTSYCVGYKTYSGVMVTKITLYTKLGMMSEIPYIGVWSEDKLIAEMCQHNVAIVKYRDK